MERRVVDVAILGAGTAGITARRSVKRAGARPLLIDPGPFGTTCARVGCMPSKLLIAAAEAAHGARAAEAFGVLAGSVRVDGPAVLERVRRERDRFVSFVMDTVEGAEQEGELVRGRARFVAPDEVEVDGTLRVQARAFVLATGSSNRVPPPYRTLGDRLLDNESVFELPDLPESVLVVGTGVMGLEIGQALHRLGVRVTLLGVRGRLGPLTDPDVLASARAVFGAELDLHPEHELESVERDGDGVRVAFRSGSRRREERYERVLLAAGRTPNLQGLNLEVTGVVVRPDGRVDFDPCTMQVGSGPIFVAGDATDHRALLHEAADGGHIAGENAARFPEVLRHPRRTPLSVVFTSPQIAIVGTPFAVLPPHAGKGEVDFGGQGRSRVMNRNAGKARVYAESERARLLGAEILGPDAEHTGHLLAWAVQAALTVEEALAMPFYHPTVEEGIRTALRDLERDLKIARKLRSQEEEYGPGA